MIDSRTLPEEWRPVDKYEGYYSVSSWGRVRSESREVAVRNGGSMIRKQGIRKPFLNFGYQRVCLHMKGKRTNHFVHVLVARAFIGPCPTGMECAHDDGVRANAFLSNLRYDTKAGNQADRLKHGTSPRGNGSRRAVLKPENIVSIREDKRTLREIASDHGTTPNAIGDVKRGRTWSYL